MVSHWTSAIFIGAADRKISCSFPVRWMTLVETVAMVLRVWIVCKKSSFILRTLLVLYAIEVTLFFVMCVMVVATQSSGIWNIHIMCIGDTHISPHHLAMIVSQVEVLDLSFCTVRAFPLLITWSESVTYIFQVLFGGLMCLLVATQFVRKSLQIYRARKRFELGHYIKLLTRDGMFYFIVYVHSLSSISFAVPLG